MNKKNKRKKHFPNDLIIMLIISELFAAGFSCLEIVNTYYKNLTESRTEAIVKYIASVDLFGENFDIEIGPEEGLIAYEEEQEALEKEAYSWDGPVLSASKGVVYGPSGKETYYNLDMSGVVSIMRNMGNTDEYWVRDDGCKMLGDYIMVAANLNIHPRGSIVETSLGLAIVCDTGGFAKNNPYQIDIATTW